mmetsp:Transcript_17052/g.46758  ORF Transcript_17052/g.46758 Transcript_17052/m.46758 type:complete len:108 (-) Transcript_17052:383-706(-)
MKFPQVLQTLDDEIEEEEESDWSQKELDHHSEKEDVWRNRIVVYEEYPDEIQPKMQCLGGKQYQRAIEFFRHVMINPFLTYTNWRPLCTTLLAILATDFNAKIGSMQ